MFTLKIKKRGRRFTQRGGRGSGARAKRATARAVKAGRPPPPPPPAKPPPRPQTPKQQQKAAAAKQAKTQRAKVAEAAGLKKKAEYAALKQKNKNGYTIAAKKKANRNTRRKAAAAKKKANKAATQKRVKNKEAANKAAKAKRIQDAEQDGEDGKPPRRPPPPLSKAEKDAYERGKKKREEKDRSAQGRSSSGFFGGLPGMLGALGQLGMAALSGLAALAGLAAQAAGALLGMLATAAKALFDVIGSLLSSIFDSLGGYTNAFKDKDGNPLPCKEQCEKIMANQSTATSNGDKKTLFEEIIRESFGENPKPLAPDEKQKMCTMLSENGDDKTCNDQRILDLINEGNKMNSHNFYTFLTIWITAGYKCELTCGKGCNNCECEEDPERKKICLSKQPAKGPSS